MEHTPPQSICCRLHGTGVGWGYSHNSLNKWQGWGHAQWQFKPKTHVQVMCDIQTPGTTGKTLKHYYPVSVSCSAGERACPTSSLKQNDHKLLSHSLSIWAHESKMLLSSSLGYWSRKRALQTYPSLYDGGINYPGVRILANGSEKLLAGGGEVVGRGQSWHRTQHCHHHLGQRRFTLCKDWKSSFKNKQPCIGVRWQLNAATTNANAMGQKTFC